MKRNKWYSRPLDSEDNRRRPIMNGGARVKVTVLGAGAIGAYVGACLSRGGSDVTLIARGQHLQAMQRHGVEVQSPLGNFTEHPKATDEFSAISDADVVFVGLKTHSLTTLAPRLGSLISADTPVIYAQNGLPWWYFQDLPGPFEGKILESTDPGGVISRAMPPDATIGCVVYCATEITKPGVVRHIEGTRFTLGEPNGTKSDRCRAIAQAFSDGGLKAPVDPNLRDQIWLKLIGNVAFNPISALTGATLGQLGSVHSMITLLRSIMSESAAVADALGVRFAVSIDRRLEAGIAVGNHKTSMLQDLEHGRQLELDSMTGAILELAQQVGIEVPHIETIHAAATIVDLLRRGELDS